MSPRLGWARLVAAGLERVPLLVAFAGARPDGVLPRRSLPPDPLPRV